MHLNGDELTIRIFVFKWCDYIASLNGGSSFDEKIK